VNDMKRRDFLKIAGSAIALTQTSRALADSDLTLFGRSVVKITDKGAEHIPAKDIYLSSSEQARNKAFRKEWIESFESYLTEGIKF